MASRVAVQQLANVNNSKVYKLMEHLSLHRHGDQVYFGKDEFPNDTSQADLLSVSDNYIVTDPASAACLGYVVLTPSLLFGNNIPAYTDIRIIPETDNTENEHVSILLVEAIELARKLDYEACVYETFVSNATILDILKTSGFQTIAVMPRSGYVFDEGWQDNVFLMKELKNIQVSWCIILCNRPNMHISQTTTPITDAVYNNTNLQA